jgi:hypothetical protein
MGDIRTSDQQDEADNAEQHDEGLVHGSGRQLAQRNQLYIVARGDGILLMQTSNDGVDIALRLREGDAGLEAADNVEIVDFAIGAYVSLPVGKGTEDFWDDVNGIDPELNIRADKAKVGREYSDDLHGLFVESEGAANRVAVAGKVALPEAVSEERTARRVESAFLRNKVAAENRVNTQKGKDVGCGDHPRNSLGSPLSGEIEAEVADSGDLLKRPILRLIVEEVGRGEWPLLQAGLGFPEPDELVWLGKG